MKYYLIILLSLAILAQSKKNIFLYEDEHSGKGKTNAIIHFINCGQADSILIEQNGRYGLIDASRPYSKADDVVESAGKRGEDSPDRSAQAVVNYLNHLEVSHLDFILATHAHSDHIGGMPQIAYHFVDKNTIYLYKQYRETREDNEAYFNAAYNSMKTKGAQLIDLTDEEYEFDFGDLHFELINTNIHKKETKNGENQNSIGAIVTYKNRRIFLAADLQRDDDLIYKDHIGKIDVLKMSHHGSGDSSFEFLNTTRPNYTVITNYRFPDYAITPTAFLQQRVGGKVFYVGGVATTSEDVANSAIRLYFAEDILDTNENTKYYLYFENSGDNYDIGTNINGLKTYQYYTFYFENGKIVTGFKEIDKHTYYFSDEGVAVTGWYSVEGKMYYFDEDGYMVTGLHTLEGEDGSCQYYFEKDGHMVKDDCVTVDGSEMCFDEKGCSK